MSSLQYIDFVLSFNLYVFPVLHAIYFDEAVYVEPLPIYLGSISSFVFMFCLSARPRWTGVLMSCGAVRFFRLCRGAAVNGRAYPPYQ